MSQTLSSIYSSYSRSKLGSLQDRLPGFYGEMEFAIKKGLNLIYYSMFFGDIDSYWFAIKSWAKLPHHLHYKRLYTNVGDTYMIMFQMVCCLTVCDPILVAQTYIGDVCSNFIDMWNHKPCDIVFLFETRDDYKADYLKYVEEQCFIDWIHWILNFKIK